MSRAAPLPPLSGAGVPGTVDPANPPRFRVLIVYEDLNGARQAMERLARAIRQRARSIVLHPMLWRFDQLADARWREHSLLDVMDSDCVVFATTTVLAFSSSGSKWLLEAVKRRAAPVMQVMTLSEAEEPWTVAIERKQTAAEQSGWPVERSRSADRDIRDLRRSA